MKDEWYFHIPVTRKNDTEFDKNQVKHVVGIDRGIRYLMTTYDQNDQKENGDEEYAHHDFRL